MTAEQMFNELTWLSDSLDDEYISFHKDRLLGYLIGLEKQLQKTAHNSDYPKCADEIQIYYEDHNDVYQSEIIKILKKHFAY